MNINIWGSGFLGLLGLSHHDFCPFMLNEDFILDKMDHPALV